MVATAEVRTIDDLGHRRMATFERRYGPGALDFACHAAFPLTLTTDLSYCLRESFFPDMPWHWAADVLLSGLCNPAGYDLYEMEGDIRHVLLRRLLSRFEEPRLWQLDQFMKDYLAHRLKVQPQEQDQLWLLGDRPHWTALACLRPDEAFAAIQQELQQLVLTNDPQDRFRMAALIESYADPLLQTDFHPMLLNFAHKLRAGEPIDETAIAAVTARQLGFVLQPLDIEFVTLVFDEGDRAVSDDVLRPFEFETVTVNHQGQEIRRESKQAFFFMERLGQTVPPLELVAMTGGRFWMGSPQAELERYDDEGPQHEVTVDPFFMSKYVITQAQWRAVAQFPQVNRSLEPDPASFKGDRRPVEQVSWEDAVEFCDRLSAFTGRTYRLPTEAEWEYACRAGTTTPFACGETITTDLANYSGSAYQQEPEGQYRQETTDVGSFPPNAFGLYDMHGNVWEWCLDHWHEHYEGAPIDGSAWLNPTTLRPEAAESNTTESDEPLITEGEDDEERRVYRGGSWLSYPRNCRSAYRDGGHPGFGYDDIGFRVVCVLPRTL